MNRKFRNMDELKEYLVELEARVEKAEKGKFSENFIRRCFQIWGHYFVANLIVGIFMAIIGAIIYAIFAGAIIVAGLGSTSQYCNRKEIGDIGVLVA